MSHAQKCYAVFVVGRDGNPSTVGTWTTPGTALAGLERMRAKWSGPGWCVGIYDVDNEEAGDCEDRLLELVCNRWGVGQDRCCLDEDHTGPCEDADGSTTLTLAAPYLGRETQ